MRRDFETKKTQKKKEKKAKPTQQPVIETNCPEGGGNGRNAATCPTKP